MQGKSLLHVPSSGKPHLLALTPPTALIQHQHLYGPFPRIEVRRPQPGLSRHHQIPVHPHRGHNSRHARRQILHHLEAALSPCPVIVENRHDTHIKAYQVPGDIFGFPGFFYDGETLHLEKFVADDLEGNAAQFFGHTGHRRGDRPEIGKISPGSDPSDDKIPAFPRPGIRRILLDVVLVRIHHRGNNMNFLRGRPAGRLLRKVGIPGDHGVRSPHHPLKHPLPPGRMGIFMP